MEESSEFVSGVVYALEYLADVFGDEIWDTNLSEWYAPEMFNRDED